ncbi:MAG: hypothetical protein ABI137_10570 [Antricoccus sp.]
MAFTKLCCKTTLLNLARQERPYLRVAQPAAAQFLMSTLHELIDTFLKIREHFTDHLADQGRWKARRATKMPKQLSVLELDYAIYDAIHDAAIHDG